MPPTGALCLYCEKIPFDPVVLHGGHGTLPCVFRLGRGDRVADSPCPFCRLVKHAYFEWRGEAPNANDTEVSVTWRQHGQPLGPAGRPAFFVDLVADIWICFTHWPTDALLAPRMDGPNYAKLAMDPVLDMARVSHWISTCENSYVHAGRCQLPTPADFATAFPGLQVLRLIDVERNCVVETQKFSKYVALSYVWGAVPNFRLTKINKPNLLVPGSLADTKVQEKLPRTIRDAMTLVRRLGERYLWVDSICLLQNDADDLGRGINVMDLIYERAWLAVIAASGYDANAGLPGIRNGTRKGTGNSIEVKPGVSLVVISGLDHLLGTTAYSSRAWTFQEQVLSRRQLHFIDNKVYFRCRSTELTEACLDPYREYYSNLGVSIAAVLSEAVHMTQPVTDYREMLVHYSRRALTHENDALRAMSGITRRFAEAMRCRFLEGIPTAVFDVFVLFRCSLGRRRPSFPSYSWAGWRGALDFELWDAYIDIDSWLIYRTWIIWHERSQSGLITSIWNPEANEALPYGDKSDVGYRCRHPFLPRQGLELPNHLAAVQTVPTDHVRFGRPLPAYSILQFWTLAVYFTIEDIDVFGGVAAIADLYHARCGTIWLDGFEETTFFQESDEKGKLILEFILLSEGASEPGRTSSFEPTRYHPATNGNYQKKFNVLLLEWRDGIAERKGIGWIHQPAIESSLSPGPVWKEIFLA